MDELTEKMHGEFIITPETEKKLQIWSVCNLISKGFSLKKAIGSLSELITEQEVIDYLPTYNKLFSKNVILKQ